MTLTRAELGDVAGELEQSLGVTLERPRTLVYRPRYNLAPTDSSFIVLPGRLATARWGFRTSTVPAVINARAETLAERPLFRGALESRSHHERGRCLVPADGFYEWHQKHPIWFHRPDGKLLLFAGLYEVEPDGGLAFTVVTTAANAQMAPIHDRMPALLAPDGAAAWLAAPRVDLLVPAPEDALALTWVADRVSSVANDDAACLEPVRPRGQLKLF
jgi:putative SOS response-associated peptidase YedK